MSHILVVDDDAVSRMVLRVMLERLGHEVTETSGVDEALAALDVQEMSLIICDYEMPERNGLDLLEARPDLTDRFVLLTGTTERQGLDDVRVDDVVCYLTKPVGSEELARLVDTLIDAAPQLSS